MIPRQQIWGLRVCISSKLREDAGLPVQGHTLYIYIERESLTLLLKL